MRVLEKKSRKSGWCCDIDHEQCKQFFSVTRTDAQGEYTLSWECYCECHGGQGEA